MSGNSVYMVITSFSFSCRIQSTSFQSFPHSAGLWNTHPVQGIVPVLIQNLREWKAGLRHQGRGLGRVTTTYEALNK